MQSRLQDKLALQGQMEAEKNFYLPMWQETFDRLWPDNSQLLRFYQPGGKRTQKMFEATAALALPKYASAMESMLTPRTQRWHGLRDQDPEMNERQDVQEYYDALTDYLFETRYAPYANFAQSTNECYLMNGACGNGVLYIDDIAGKGRRYKSCHIAEIFYAESYTGMVDLVHRKFKYTVRQAYQRFQGNLPPALLRLCDKPAAYLDKFTFIHCVEPNEDYKPGALGDRGLKYLSSYICEDEAWLCRDTGGYRAFPYALSRHMTVPGDVYARGPASLVLPDIKQLNEMEKTLLRQAQLAVDPPTLLPEDGYLSGFNMTPSALIWGGMNADGKPVVQPYQTGGNISLGFEAQEQKRKVINDAFLINLFQILVDGPEMTATEAMLRAQEKGQLLAPTMGRNQTEFLGPIIERELEIEHYAGRLPPPPPVLAQRGVNYQIEYVSPLNRAQQAEEGVAINQTLQSAGIAMQFDPTVAHMFDGQEIVRTQARIFGMPAKLLKSADSVNASVNAQAQQAQQQAALAAAPQAASAAKDIASAQATANTAPSQIAQVIAPRAAA